jgi:methyl-accepting chemotaxis protein
MRAISFSKLLLLVVFIPLTALMLFVGELTYESWTRYAELSRASTLLRLAVAVGRFSGIAIPAEGAATREIIAGASNRSVVDAQRRVTDDLYRAVREAAAANAVQDARIEGHLKALEDRMREIAAMREKVDAKAVAAPTASTAVLAPAAARGIDLVGSAAAAAGDAILSSRIFAIYTALQLNENSLLQRGFVQMGLEKGQLATEQFLILAKAITHQATFTKLFNEFAPAEIASRYRAFEAANGRELQELREFVLKNAGTPASDAQLKRWLELNRDLTQVLTGILNATFERVSAESAEMLSAAQRSVYIYIGLILAILAVVAVLTRTALRTLRELLGSLARTMDELGKGHFDIEVPHVRRDDEIGVMARATESFRTNLVQMKEREAEQKNAEAIAQRKAAMNTLATDFETVMGGIVVAVSSASAELEAMASTLATDAESTQHLSATVATASEQASANVRSVAESTEELTNSVAEISRQVAESGRISGEAVNQAHKTDERVTELSRAAQRIGDVVKLITAIAEQTNLLALNATIEAARAGEAGRGFAVVAQEVKALASQTAKATSEISEQISGMQAATHEAVGAIKEIGDTIGRISEIATNITSAVEQQGAATQEIARNIHQATQGTAQVAANIGDVNRKAAATQAASSKVLSSSKAMSAEGERLKAEVQKFLATIRAA